jgi:uncharacterized protein YcbK (DUF882 family)
MSQNTKTLRRTRRTFLRDSGLALASLMPLSAWAASRERSLALVHAHTGEKLTTVYYRNGEYDRVALERMNYLLRDFRTDEEHAIDPRLFDILFALRVGANRGDAFAVVSGYRSPKTNAELRRHSSGVAEHSLHMQGRAIDLRLPGFPTGRLHQLAMGLQRGGVGYYPESDFIHVDTGRVRFW